MAEIERGGRGRSREEYVDDLLRLCKTQKIGWIDNPVSRKEYGRSSDCAKYRRLDGLITQSKLAAAIFMGKI